ncbi:3-epi-6-deoxocathasterone 23-monooxygenase CYP90C1-like isoform X2 [Vigna unguiculata]|uniref:3-epi-6-deoxocathasterone 23-monooxygenase CYP90C1-like isoform X2 n=1 Tax=Vigna unguiculata TaxID=3917 RepID=UPI001015DBEC|nr:3-epi-6-deoxocathasterone 23-monooxygenase CYP90C1-like isoform X2 [Vigna unguiculata]
MCNPTLIYKEGQKEVSSKHSIPLLSLFFFFPFFLHLNTLCMILCDMEWIIGLWSLMGIILTWCCYWFLCVKKDNGNRVKQKKKKKGKVPRGNKGWPLLGETLEFIACGYTSNPVSFMEKRKSLYGSVFKTSILGTGVIVSTDPEVNKVILQNQGNIFVPAYPKSVRELMGDYSILQMNGNMHRKIHSLLGGFLRSPQFKARITADIQHSVKQCFATWIHQPIYVQDQVKKITFTILVKVLLSIGPGEDLDFLKREFEEFIKGLICLPLKFPGTRLYKSLKAKERMMKIVKRVIEERNNNIHNKKNTEEKGGAVNDVVDVLLRDIGDSNTISNMLENICENIIEMMIPGEETLPTAMTMAVKFLSDSPLALSKLLEENMELKRQKNCAEDYVWSDYLQLPFTQNVISETLRMANIVNAIWRKAVKDVEIKGYLIPKDWCVVASLSSVHMDNMNYENPFKFDPWRWEKSGGGANNNWFTPFGGGQRLCPGIELSRLELSIFLHHLVTTYSLYSADGLLRRMK